MGSNKAQTYHQRGAGPWPFSSLLHLPWSRHGLPRPQTRPTFYHCQLSQHFLLSGINLHGLLVQLVGDVLRHVPDVAHAL